MAIRKLASLLAAACALSGAPAQAEQLAIDGVYAARSDGALGIEVIQLEPVRGRDGHVLESALAAELDRAWVHGAPLFTVVPAGFRPPQQDAGVATLSGYANSDVTDFSDGAIERSRCVRKEDVGKKKKQCVESVTDVFECRRLQVSFHPEVFLTTDEGMSYRREGPQSRSERYCADSSYVPSVDGMLNAMVAGFARQVRLDLAPEQRFERFRILESRKGLAGADRKAFKRAVKLTKSDPVGACLEFEDIRERNPFQRSALYNAALCREAEGQLDAAADAYAQLVRTHDMDRFHQGMARVNSRFRAEQQLAFLNRRDLALAVPAAAEVAE